MMILYVCLLLVFTFLLTRTMVMRALQVVKSNKKLVGVVKQHEELKTRTAGRVLLQVGSVESDGRPVYSLISRCPECTEEKAHLLMNLTATVADRKCVECDHTWKEQVVV